MVLSAPEWCSPPPLNIYLPFMNKPVNYPFVSLALTRVFCSTGRGLSMQGFRLFTDNQFLHSLTLLLLCAAIRKKYIPEDKPESTVLSRLIWRPASGKVFRNVGIFSPVT